MTIRKQESSFMNIDVSNQNLVLCKICIFKISHKTSIKRINYAMKDMLQYMPLNTYLFL